MITPTTQKNECRAKVVGGMAIFHSYAAFPFKVYHWCRDRHCCMKPRHLLTLIASETFAVSLPAQKPLPASTQERLATSDLLNTPTQKDIADISSKTKSGDEKAQYWLALINSQGRLFPKNQDAAREWMLRPAQQGCAAAQEGMSGIYLSGEGIRPRDNSEAQRWSGLAATQSSAEAQFSSGGRLVG